MGSGKLRLSLIIALCSASLAHAQLDTDKRELIQFGYNQPVEGYAPLSLYAFYYLNIPDFVRTNLYLRLALAPVYLDSELGFKGALGPHTDLGLGLSGGGFGDSYFEFQDGDFIRSESFIGHGGGPSASVYHLFNPDKRIPLYGVARTEFHYSAYKRDSDTAQDFVLPENRGAVAFRSGFRWGGQEPVILPAVAMELSAWYEGVYRMNSGRYGFNYDRNVEQISHLFWARGLLTYTLPNLEHRFHVSITMGTSIDADRFSAYRLGGMLPLVSEFPLSLPGYYFHEISGQDFVLFNGFYSIPLDPKKDWALTPVASAARVDYLPGLEQRSHWLKGVGAGISYRSPHKAWQFVLAYGYGIDATRGAHTGAHSIGILAQLDLDRAGMGVFESGENPIRSHGLERILRGINPF